MFQTFRNVDGCFGMKLEPDFTTNCGKLENSSLGIPVSSKIHGVFFHAEDFVPAQERFGIFQWVNGSVHFEFNCTWQKNKVPKDHTEYVS